MNIFKIPNDFNINMYRSINKDLKNLTDQELLNHYRLHGIHEKRYYKYIIPDDFDVNIYRNNYDDLTDLSDEELKIHYFLYGKKENRVYNLNVLPHNFNKNVYRIYNNDLYNLSDNELEMHYMKFGINENRIYSSEQIYYPYKEFEKYTTIKYFIYNKYKYLKFYMDKMELYINIFKHNNPNFIIKSINCQNFLFNITADKEINYILEEIKLINDKEVYIFDELTYSHLLSLYDNNIDTIKNFLKTANYIIFFCEIFQNANLQTIGNDLYNIEFSKLFFKNSIKTMICNSINIYYLNCNDIFDNIIYYPPYGYSKINNIDNILVKNNILDIDLLFMGNISETILPYRSKKINELINYCNLNNYNFKYYNCELFDELKNNTLKNTKIVIHIPSFENLVTIPWAKIVELMCKKIFFIVEYNKEFETKITLNKLLVYYYPTDNIDKQFNVIKTYINDEKMRNTVIENNYNYIINAYNMDNFLKYIFIDFKSIFLNNIINKKFITYKKIKYISRYENNFHYTQIKNYISLFKKYNYKIITDYDFNSDYNMVNNKIVNYMLNKINNQDISKYLYIFNSLDYYYFLIYLNYDNFNIFIDFFKKINYIFIQYEVIFNDKLQQIGTHGDLINYCNNKDFNNNEKQYFSIFFYKNSLLNILCNTRNINFLQKNNIVNNIYYLPIIYNNNENIYLNKCEMNIDILLYCNNSPYYKYRNNMIEKINEFSKLNNINFVMKDDIYEKDLDNYLKKTKIVIHIPSHENLHTFPWAKTINLMYKKQFFIIEENEDMFLLNLQDKIVYYKHNDIEDLQNKILYYLNNYHETLPFIENVYNYITSNYNDNIVNIVENYNK